MGLDDRQLSLLKRKLEALNYTQPLDPLSAPLVQSLVDDLVHTTETYRTLKVQGVRQGQEIENFSSQIDVLKKDGGRLTAENNNLHLELIRSTEKYERREREHYQETKKLEDQIAELAYWKAQTVERFKDLENENNGLKEKLKDLLQKSGVHGLEDTPKIKISNNLGPSVNYKAHDTDAGTVNLIASADKRIALLEQEIAAYRAGNEALSREKDDWQISAKKKDDEIKRLGMEVVKGQDLEKLDLKYRNESNENVIMSLNQQVDYLSTQISSLEIEVQDKRKTEVALEECEKSRAEAVDRLEKALMESSAVMSQVQDLQKGLLSLQRGNSKNGKALANERDGALGQVAMLMARLTDAQSGNDSLTLLLEAAEKEREKANEKQQELIKEIRNQQDLLDAERGNKDSLHVQVVAMNSELEETRSELKKSCESLEACQRKLLQMESLRAEHQEIIRTLQEDKELTQAKLEGAQGRLHDLETTAAHERTTVVTLEANKNKTASEVRRLESNLAAAESELNALRERLRELNSQKMQLTNALQMTESEQQTLSQDLAILSAQLKEERSTNEDLVAHRDGLEMEVGRLQSQLVMLQNEKHFLSENLETSTNRLKEGQQKLTVTSRELAQLQSMPQKVDELQAQLKDYAEQLSNAEVQSSNTRVENARLSEALQLAKTDVSSLQRTLDDAECERNQLRLKLEETEHQVSSIVTSIKALEAERDREQKTREAAEAELRQMREDLEDRSVNAKDLDYTVRSLEQKIRATNQELSSQTNEVDRLQRLLAEAHQCADQARQREEETRNQYHEVAARMHRAEAMNEEFEAELTQVRSQHDAEHSRLQELDEMVSRLRAENEAKRKEIDQLTTLTLKGDATVQEYMKNMKTMSASFRAAQTRAKELEGEVENQESISGHFQKQLEDLKASLHELDGERDRLQDELDVKDETISNMTIEIELGHKQLNEAEQLISSTEARLSQASQRIKDLEEETIALENQSQTLQNNLQGLQAEHNALKDEYRAVSDDLEVMVKENQVVSGQLVTVGGDRENAHKEIQNLHARLANAEQTINIKETGIEDIRHAYEILANENRQLQGTLNQLERDAASREAHLNSKATEALTLQEAQRSAQSQINQYLTDLQAFEKQVDSLSRDLAHKDDELEDAQRERELMMDQLRAAEHVRFDMEGSHDNYRRQLAGMDSQIDILKGRLQDSNSEISSMKHALQLKVNRVKELEALLLEMRSKEFRTGSASQSTHERIQALEERNRILGDQVAHLQHEAHQAQESCDQAERELMRMRSEMPSGNRGFPDDPSLPGSLLLQVESLQIEKKFLEEEVSRLQAELDFQTFQGIRGTDHREDSNNSGMAMEKEVNDLRMRIQEQGSLLSSSGRTVNQLNEQKSQLQEMVIKLETEKNQLASKNDELHAEVQSLQVALGQGMNITQPTTAASGHVEDDAYGGSTAWALRSQLEEERGRRDQTAADFHMFMDTVRGMSATPSTPSRAAVGETASDSATRSTQYSGSARQPMSSAGGSGGQIETIQHDSKRVKKDRTPPRGLGGSGLKRSP